MATPEAAQGAGKRVLIIGLDGGTWEVLDRYMDLGHMPFLSELCRSGCRTELLSTNPPITPVAWASFATGMNPGKHGVFGFLSPQSDPGSYCPPPIRRDAVRAPSLWRRLSDAGLRATVLSVPLTYPPEPVNGHMVTGMFTPDSAEDSTHPPSLAAELDAEGAMPQFRLSSRLTGRTVEDIVRSAESLDDRAERFFDALRDMTERLRRASLKLMQEPWDLFVAVFMATDRIQHVLWDEVMESSPDSPLGKRICELYRHIDDSIADLVRASGGEAVTFVMSDHGFGPCAGNLAMDKWLVDEGYARHAPRRVYRSLRRALSSSGLLRVAGRVMARSSSVDKAVRANFIPFDWSRTRAFLQPGTDGGIRVNLRGRESQGCVEPGEEYERLLADLKRRLLEMRDPESGEPVISKVRLSSELHHGPETVWAPDLTPEPSPSLGHHLVPGDPADSVLVRKAPKTRGSHRPEGILAVAGAGVDAVPMTPRSICDITPTVLWLLGLPVPETVDGSVIREPFPAEPGPTLVADSAAAAAADEEDGGDTESDREEILRRLRDLGYVE